MKMTKTMLPGDVICLTDGNGQHLLMKCYKNNARILFTDDNKYLVIAAEQLASDQGETLMECDFPFGNEVYRDLFSECEYTLRESKDIISIKTSEAFSSKGVEKTLQHDFTSLEWYPFRDLLLYQVEELESIFAERHIPLRREDIVLYDDDLSGVLYDDELVPKAILLVSVYGNEVLVEFIHGIVRDKPVHIMAALQGFGKEFMRHQMMEIYERISMINVNESILPLIHLLVDKQYEPDKVDRCVTAKKDITGGDLYEKIIIDEDPKAVYESILKEIRHYQHNLNWKMQWVRDSEQ